MYIGDYISEEQASKILGTRQSECIESLKKTIFKVPLDIIRESVETGEAIYKVLEKHGDSLANHTGELRDYQTLGTAFMYLSPRSIIADGCGLGKTAEIAALINWLKYKTREMTRFLIAVEPSAVGQTQIELMKFTAMNVVALPSEAVKLRRVIKNTDWTKVNGIVVRHTTLRSDVFQSWLALNLDENGMCNLFNTFFLDESSVIKNSKTKLWTYTENICRIVKRVHFMNATVFETHLGDIYNQIDMVNPTLLPKRYKIDREFCTYEREMFWRKENGKAKKQFANKLSGYKNQEVFKNSLKLVYFGRSSKDVNKELPHIYRVYCVEPTTEMQLAVQKKYRYTEVLNCPSLIKELNIPTDRENVPKLDRLCQLVENEFGDSKIMIYCFHLKAQEAIKRELEKIGRKPAILNGAISSDDDRYTIQHKFNSGEYDVVITNIKKSINLYGGDVCIFYSLETNIAKMEQIRGRIDRHVDESIKTFVLLLYEHSDEHKFFADVVCQRAQDARDLTIDSETAADYFKLAMEKGE